jgi:carbamoyltransferase
VSLIAGLGGARRNACVSLCTPTRVVGISEHERITRVRAASVNPSGLPDETLNELLRRSGRETSDIASFAVTDDFPRLEPLRTSRFDHHLAHAAAAFLPSPFEAATIVVCDHEPPQVSVWDGNGRSIVPVEWLWTGVGFAELYSQCANVLGFTSHGREQRLEALARLRPGERDDRAALLFGRHADGLVVSDDWKSAVERWIGESGARQLPAIASALQGRIGDLLLEFLADVRRHAPARRQLCVGGSLFNNSCFNSRVKLETGYEQVYVPINADDAGLALGAALLAAGNVRLPVTPFLGPAYTDEEIKAILDNCKLTYQWASENETITIAIDALRKGRLVAWFDGAMEWGPRALGGRSILANPFAPYVLDNLNRFLKEREVWRGYALSGLQSAVDRLFDGPDGSPFMECDYVPKDRGCFRHILPGPCATVRLHTVGLEGPPRFRALLEAFGDVTGQPILVNTSFNGFREPIVCSPRDAVRVFFGTGIDLLVLGEFVITK